MTDYYFYIIMGIITEVTKMDMMITSIKISRKVREAARIRADDLNLTFQSYYEDLILKDIKDNKPELFEELCSGREFNKNRKMKQTILQTMIQENDEERKKGLI